MKRILIAFSISLVCVVLYYFFVYFISSFLLGTSPLSPHPTLYAPISLPATVFQAIAPDSIQDLLASNPIGGIVERLMYILGNVLLFAVPVYILSLLLFRRRDGK
ncbi:MAG TPA: hypothetical protein PKD24_00660 [Pyrinomonadaceae bacterium]|nr:hypothetical protein [Pyrinomonadaceae bacterium]HMP64333.1 hypothetical protein [Pyrinomonadaceae bacterium]